MAISFLKFKARLFFLIPAFVYLFMPYTSFAACGSILLDTQAKVDDFASRGCDGVIAGDLTILDQSPGEIVNLNGLDSLTTVEGIMDISDTTALTNLNGLNALTAVKGSFFITRNEALSIIDGLNALKSVGGRFFINKNPNLTNVKGINALATVGTELFIDINISLEVIAGLNALQKIGDILNIAGNPSLRDITGLRVLTSVGSDLNIEDNGILENFCGIFALMDSGGLLGSYNVSGNALDPSMEEILNAGPCDADADGVPDTADICPNTAIPESSIKKVRPFRWALIDNDTDFDTKWPFIPFSFSTKDTGGCTCEQIADVLNLKKRYYRKGCGTFLIKYWIHTQVKSHNHNDY